MPILQTFAPYAVQDGNSRGRRVREEKPAYRSEFQRDRDRIVHSTAFRRLEYKTQVFINHEGDLFRTRLTHSIEVAQIARAIARVLRLNEDLAEAIALAHDLGHTPFGHAGQDELNDCMEQYGGFEHNWQSLRVVDVLEEKYADFAGLNLTFEAREGILKHCSPTKAKQLGDIGERFLKRQQPSLEAQVTNLADEIAYNNHDVDDGLRAEFLTIEQLLEVKLFAEQYEIVMSRFPTLTDRRVIHETVRRMINRLVTDLIKTSEQNLVRVNPRDVDEVRNQSDALISFSPQMLQLNLELKQFLRKNLYAHYRVIRMTRKAKEIIRDLFVAFMDDIRLLPPEHAHRARDHERVDGASGKARAIADYIAGMTDRYAFKEHGRLFGPFDN